MLVMLLKKSVILLYNHPTSNSLILSPAPRHAAEEP